MIDVVEERSMGIFDVPRSYSNGDIPGENILLIKLEDEFVSIMCEVNPEFINDVQREENKNLPYLRVLKALYRCIDSALLCYNIYKDTL